MRFFGRNQRVETSVLTKADIERAYERGREDERKRHRRRRHPVLGFLVFVAAVAGVAMIYLAAQQGSFTRGGQVVDQKLATAADHAQVASQDAAVAADKAGQSAQNAGETLRQNTINR